MGLYDTDILALTMRRWPLGVTIEDVLEEMQIPATVVRANLLALCEQGVLSKRLERDEEGTPALCFYHLREDAAKPADTLARAVAVLASTDLRSLQAYGPRPGQASSAK